MALSNTAASMASDGTAASVRWRRARLLLSAIALVALAVLLWRAWDLEALLAWKAEAGPVRFFAAMSILPALGMPTTPLFLLAGATFGRTLGLVGSGVALALNLALCHWIASSGLRPRIKYFLERFHYELPDFTAKPGALRFTVMVKLMPGLPSAAKNYLLGLSEVPFPTYFVVGMVTTGAYAAALVVLGESLFEHDLRQVLWSVAALAVVLVGVWWVRKRWA